jgi:hypothetical protein
VVLQLGDWEVELIFPHCKKKIYRLEQIHWGSVAVSSTHGNVPSVSTKAGEFLDQFSDYQLLKRALLRGFNYV